MLYITDSNGVRKTGITLEYRESESGAEVTLDARVYETDTSLVGRYVSGVLQWNDGTGEAISFGTMSINAFPQGYWAMSATRNLMPGKYVCAFRVQNYRSPVEDVARLNFFVTVIASKPVYNPPSLIFGPILPRDLGYPNSQQWEFNIDSDLIILESSVKMLLLTSKGDRVMEPGYGTYIRRILFDMNVKSTESLLREEIASALAEWEPRVEIAGLSVDMDANRRTATLALTLVSRLNKQAFETRVQYQR